MDGNEHHRRVSASARPEGSVQQESVPRSFRRQGNWGGTSRQSSRMSRSSQPLRCTCSTPKHTRSLCGETQARQSLEE